MIEVLFYPVRFLVGQPGSITVIGGLFIALAVWHYFAYGKFCWPPVVASLTWFVLAYWESVAVDEEWDIRIDYIVILPVLFVVTVNGLVRGVRRPLTPPPPASTPPGAVG